MPRSPQVIIPQDRDSVELRVDGRHVRLTNLRKVFWPGLGITKGTLLQYYADVSDVLLPHIADRAMEGAPRLRTDRARADAERILHIAKAFGQEIAARYPALVTTQYRVAKRPAGRLTSTRRLAAGHWRRSIR